MQIVLSGILNGLGWQMFIFRNSILSSAICIGFIWFLVPRFGISAYIMGWFASLIVVIALEIDRIRKSISLEMEFLNWFAKPLLAAAMAGLTARMVYERIFVNLTGPGIMGQRISLVLAVGLLTGVYILVVVLTGCIKREEVKRLFRKSGRE
jgi:stage V sporulation protein B